MSWIIFALLCVLGWGFADLFYKRSSDESDRYSHLKIAVNVGLVMGSTSFVLLLFSENGPDFEPFFHNVVNYAPASLSYIISMVIGYAGLRYLELSIVSPVQNASGAFSMIAMVVYFSMTGRIGSIGEEFSILDILGTLLIIIGVILLAVVEERGANRGFNITPNFRKKRSGEGKVELGKSEGDSEQENFEGNAEHENREGNAEPENGGGNAEPGIREDRKYRFGALALLFPVLYCVFDTIGTAADGVILEGSSGLGLSEIDVLILYGLTFFLAGVVCYLVLWVKEKKPYNPFRKQELTTKGIAAVCEEFGQIFYVYAMAKNPVLSAPLVASYCIISVLLSRFIDHEKLQKAQYACVILVIIGIVLLGISEGIAEI